MQPPANPPPLLGPTVDNTVVGMMACFDSYQIGLLKCSAMKGSLLCTDCKRLEREYQLTIVEIYSVVGRRFKTVGEKLHELFRWQDMRDKGCEGVLPTQKDSHKGSFESAQGSLSFYRHSLIAARYRSLLVPHPRRHAFLSDAS